MSVKKLSEKVKAHIFSLNLQNYCVDNIKFRFICFNLNILSRSNFMAREYQLKAPFKRRANRDIKINNKANTKTCTNWKVKENIGMIPKAIIMLTFILAWTKTF